MDKSLDCLPSLFDYAALTSVDVCVTRFSSALDLKPEIIKGIVSVRIYFHLFPKGN